MRADQVGLAQLRAYQNEVARPQVRAAERSEQVAPGEDRPVDSEAVDAVAPRDLGKGKLLDIYG